MEKTRTYIIIPTNGKNQAPGIAVNVSTNDKNGYITAIKEAKTRSRLSDFSEWVFI